MYGNQPGGFVTGRRITQHVQPCNLNLQHVMEKILRRTTGGNKAPDLFAAAKASLTIPDAWRALNLPGTPKPSSHSPFREDRNASLSIFAGGSKWKDHGTGEGGDVIAFLKIALGNYSAVREWLQGGTAGIAAIKPASRSIDPKPTKQIIWPAELSQGSRAVWERFTSSRNISFNAMLHMVKYGFLKFLRIKDHDCFAITDSEQRSAEIRRIDRGLFYNDIKAYPLKGVDKSWLPGSALLRDTPKTTNVLLVEGATDFLAAHELCARLRGTDTGGLFPTWVPVALLGANCQSLSPDCAKLLRHHHVRIVPDADAAGDEMAKHWCPKLSTLGCSVDVFQLDRGHDLTDVIANLKPEDLFHRA
jgi:hypothetical protein